MKKKVHHRFLLETILLRLYQQVRYFTEDIIVVAVHKTEDDKMF